MQIRSVVPADEWPQTAAVLARLQGICRVELSQQADVAAAALELANSAKVLPPEDTVNSEMELSALSSADLEDGSGAAPPLKPSSGYTATSTGSQETGEDARSSQTPSSSSSSGAAGGTLGRNGAKSSSEQTAAPAGSISYVAQELGGDSGEGMRVGDGTQIANFARNVLETVDLEDVDTAPKPPVASLLVAGASALRGSQYLTGSIQKTSPTSIRDSVSGGSYDVLGSIEASGAGNDSGATLDASSKSSSISDGAYRGGSMRGGQAVGGKVATSPSKAKEKVDVLASREGQVRPTRAPLARNSGLGLQLQWFTLRSHIGPLTHSEAKSLDLLFTQQLLALAGSAHFGGAIHTFTMCSVCVAEPQVFDNLLVYRLVIEFSGFHFSFLLGMQNYLIVTKV